MLQGCHNRMPFKQSLGVIGDGQLNYRSERILEIDTIYGDG